MTTNNSRFAKEVRDEIHNMIDVGAIRCLKEGKITQIAGKQAEAFFSSFVVPA